MVWIAEVPAPSVPSRGRFFALLRAELRRSWWMQPAMLGAGLGVWALLTAVTSRVPTNARPEGVVFNYLGSLLLSVAPLLLWGPSASGRFAVERLRFWLGLPITHRTVNLLRVLGPALLAWPAALTWPLIIGLLARVYGPVSPWLVVNAALLVAVGVLLAARTVLAPFFIYVLLPLQVALTEVLPQGHPLPAAWAATCVSPWTSMGLFIALAVLAAAVLRGRPPLRS